MYLYMYVSVLEHSNICVLLQYFMCFVFFSCLVAVVELYALQTNKTKNEDDTHLNGTQERTKRIILNLCFSISNSLVHFSFYFILPPSLSLFFFHFHFHFYFRYRSVSYLSGSDLYRWSVPIYIITLNSWHFHVLFVRT